MENYFAFYGLPLRYEVDQADLRRRYLEVSKQYHPDFHTPAAPEIQQEALVQSTTNSVAYETLQNDELRLQHLFQLYGLLGSDGQNLSASSLPSEFLMEMMDFNERLDELTAPQTAHDLQTELDTMLQQNQSALLDSLLPFDEAGGGDRPKVYVAEIPDFAFATQIPLAHPRTAFYLCSPLTIDGRYKPGWRNR